MRKHKRSSSLLATEKQNLIFGGRQRRRDTNDDKRGNGAKDCSLRSLAPRPRLFCTAGIIAGICMVGGIAVSLSDASAVSATLSVPDSVSVNANPSANNGFAESSNSAVSVKTGNLAGYTLSIKAKDSAKGNALVNTNVSSAKLNSITSNLTADQYKSGNYTNTWGFKPSAINNNTNTSYVPGPTTSGITLAKTNVNSSTAENYSLGIATKVDSNTIAGNYQNTFVLTATANEAKYNITYNLNGGSGGPSKTTETGDIGSSTEIAISSTAPTPPSGKDFLGWCSKNPSTSDTCDGVLIQPGKSLYLCKCDLNITLYAMYGKKPISSGDNGTDCSFVGVNGYWYGGLCWMWQNYRTNVNWSTARTTCPSPWRLPSKNDFQKLLNNIGTGAQLYSAGWTGGGYWSSTPDTYGIYYLDVGSGAARFSSTIDGGTSSINTVRCVVQL